MKVGEKLGDSIEDSGFEGLSHDVEDEARKGGQSNRASMSMVQKWESNLTYAA